jgi:phosphatidylinositol-3-phosphatase
MYRLIRAAVLALALAHWGSRAVADPLPRYDHILVIILENHGSDQIIGNPNAPNLNRLASSYGSATRFYGEVHPSEANYIAMIGGDTFGIHDDDAWYCERGNPDRYCSSQHSIDPYVNHTITSRSLIDQLADHGLTWKGYFESIPEPGSLAVYFPDRNTPVPGLPNELYGSKHNGFINFRIVQSDPNLANKFVGFDSLYDDLARGQVPHYAHIVPNQCNDMHGLGGPNVPDDCRGADGKRIARGDSVVGELVARIEASPIWTAPGNAAIVITWDEGISSPQDVGPQGCCGFDKVSAANFGGGHIPTFVLTNHGPRGLVDETPYNHYSLLRTTEEALGIEEYLGHANDIALGVKPMTPLFEVK